MAKHLIAYHYKTQGEHEKALALYKLNESFVPSAICFWKEKENAKEIEKLAEQGYSFAQNITVDFHLNGTSGYKQDPSQAFQYYKKAALQNHADAQNNLAYLYMNGVGCQKDAVKGVKWYKKSAGQDYAPAQNCLGWIYIFGYSGKEDQPAGYELFKKLSEKKDKNDSKYGYYALGVCSEQGKGIFLKDPYKALKFYVKARYLGHEEAKEEADELFQEFYGKARKTTSLLTMARNRKNPKSDDMFRILELSKREALLDDPERNKVLD